MRLIRLFFIVMVFGMFGCGESTPADNLTQINNTTMYISNNPIQVGTTIIFEERLTDEIYNNIEQHINNTKGPENAAIQLDDGGELPLSEVMVTGSRIEQEITVSQGETVLYNAKKPVTGVNLRELGSIRLSSDDWYSPINLEGGNIIFTIDYRRYWETEKHGQGMTLIQSSSCQIPVK